jgi:hypothetical protein
VYWSRGEANKLIGEANTAINDGNALVNEAGTRFDELMAKDKVVGFPGNRKDNTAKAQEATDLYTKAIDKFRLAADEFDKAAEHGVDKAVAEYWQLKAKVFRKLIESYGLRREMVSLYLDDGVADVDNFLAKRKDLNQRVVALDKEADELEAQAKKIEEDNKSELKNI